MLTATFDGPGWEMATPWHTLRRSSKDNIQDKWRQDPSPPQNPTPARVYKRPPQPPTSMNPRRQLGLVEGRGFMLQMMGSYLLLEPLHSGSN